MFKNDPELDGPLPSFTGSCAAVGGDVAKTPSCQTMRSRKSEVKRVKVLRALAGYQTAFGDVLVQRFNTRLAQQARCRCATITMGFCSTV